MGETMRDSHASTSQTQKSPEGHPAGLTREASDQGLGASDPIVQGLRMLFDDASMTSN